jgi:hypothetical protein
MLPPFGMKIFRNNCKRVGQYFLSIIKESYILQNAALKIGKKMTPQYSEVKK